MRVAMSESERTAQESGDSAAGPGTLREFKDAAERAYLVQKLRENNWNISRTAELIDTPAAICTRSSNIRDQAGSGRVDSCPPSPVLSRSLSKGSPVEFRDSSIVKR